MTLNIGSALSGGFRRFVNRNGLVLTLVYVIVGIVWQLAFYSAFVTMLQRSDAPMEEVALPSIELPFAVSVGAAVLFLLVLQYLSIVAIRTFVGGHSRSIPSEYFTRNVLLAVVNTILGGIVFGLLVFIGTILLIVPGIIAYVAFTFVVFYVAVEDENFIAALRDSWSLTRGSWIRLFVLLFIIAVLIGGTAGVLSALTSMILAVAVGQGVATLVSGTITLPLSLLSFAILADAFTQLQTGRAQH